MAVVRSLRVHLLVPLLFGALCTACGGDADADADESAGEQQDPGGSERTGPAGCYLEAERRCDCEIEEAACGDEGQTWVDMGCASCAT